MDSQAVNQIVEGVFEAVGALDATGRILILNAGFDRLLGYTPETRVALHGQSVVTLFEELSGALVSEILRNTLEDGHWHGEVLFRQADGQALPVYFVGTRLENPSAEGAAVMFAALDFAEQRYALSDLRRRNAILQQLLLRAPLGIIAADPKGVVLEVNDEAQSIWKSVGSSIGTGMELTLAFAEFNPVLQYTLQDALRGKPDRLRRQPLLSDEAVPVVSVEFVPQTRRSGELENVLIFIEDRTAEIQFEDRLRETERFASLGLMAAGLAHEINNKLQPLKVGVERIGRKRGELGVLIPGMSVQGQRQFDTIITELAETESHCMNAVDNIDRILRRVLDLAYPQSALIESTDLPATVERLLGQHAHHKALAGITTRIDAVSPPSILTDRGLLEQILTNLIINASQAMKGSGDVTIAIAAGPEAGSVSVCVSDTGPGVDPANAAHLFTPFFTTKPVGEGTGLGLYVSRTMAQKLGGWLEYVDDGQPGACFRLTLPIEYQGPVETADDEGKGYFRRGVL